MARKEKAGTNTKTVPCVHCGQHCPEPSVVPSEPSFCCHGCRLVYHLLKDNNLGQYYQSSETSIIGIRPKSDKDYSFLDDPSISDRLLKFSSGDRSLVVLELPDIHCTACIWLLERLSKLNPGVISSRVDFLKKTCTINFDPSRTKLSELAQLLHMIGYTPRFNQDQLDEEGSRSADKTIFYKIGVAGFCFGNIMLLSFPEYLGLQETAGFGMLGYLNILLALPVILYSGVDYLQSAIRALKMGKLGIDVPIALGIVVLFSRSVFEILTGTGVGYLDSLAGFIFFLLIGRWFQQYSQKAISFDRDYRSFFPMSVMAKTSSGWTYRNVRQLTSGTIIQIKNEEIIPCDSVLIDDNARMDYSFVTGEERVQSVRKGEQVFAGGKVKGQAVTLEVKQPVDQSYLTQLWQDDVFKKQNTPPISRIIETVGHYFVLTILVIAGATLLYWINRDATVAFNATTAVLIIACPCVLALSIPFIYGNMLRILARHQIYCRNTAILESIPDMDVIVFDKTGTLTDSGTLAITYEGETLDESKLSMIGSLARHSAHPLSQAIAGHLDQYSPLTVTDYLDYIGKGISGKLNTKLVRLGSPGFIFNTESSSTETEVLVEIDGKYLGRYIIHQELRPGIQKVIHDLNQRYDTFLLTGDNAHDEQRMLTLFNERDHLKFNQQPSDKLSFVNELQLQGRRAIMIGDGLNDAGALKKSDIGMVITHSTNNFTPACDIIVQADAIPRLQDYLSFIKGGRKLLYGAFGFALLYNVIGLYFAVTGQLAPVVAAILMPISSLTILFYGLISTEVLRILRLRP